VRITLFHFLFTDLLVGGKRTAEVLSTGLLVQPAAVSSARAMKGGA
jgi:hypothetical protein